MKQHQGEECGCFHRRLWRHERPNQASQTDGLAEIGPYEHFAPGGRIAFVEDEINHRQHGIEAHGHVVRVGHGIRDAGIADLTLGTHEALRHRRCRHEKRAGDLVGLEAAQRSERQCNLCLAGRRGGSR